MRENELKNLWKQSMTSQSIQLDINQMAQQFQLQMNTMNAKIKKRDRNEIIASALGIPGYGYLAYEIPYPVSKLGCLLIVGWFVFVIFKFLDQRKHRKEVDLTQSFSDQLKEQKGYMQHQEKLLKGIWSWYILPPFLANIVFLMGLGNPEDYGWTGWLSEIFEFSIFTVVGGIIFLAAFMAFVIYINVDAANKVFKPIQHNIEELEHQIAE